MRAIPRTPLRGARLGPGGHRLVFDGRGLASGVYLCCLETGGDSDVKKIVIAR